MFQKLPTVAAALALSEGTLGSRSASVAGLRKLVAAGIVGTAIFTAAAVAGVTVSTALTFFG